MRDWKRFVMAWTLLACAAVIVLPTLAQEKTGKTSCAELARRGGFADAPYTCVGKSEVAFEGAAQVRRTTLATETRTMRDDGVESESISANVTEVVNGRMTSDDPELSRQFSRYPNLVTLGPASGTEGSEVWTQEAGARIQVSLENCACAGCRTYFQGNTTCSVAKCDSWCCVCIGAS